MQTPTKPNTSNPVEVDDDVLTMRKPLLSSSESFLDSPFSPLALISKSLQQKTDFINEVFKLRGSESTYRLKDSTDVEPIWKLSSLLEARELELKKNKQSSPKVSTQIKKALGYFMLPPRYEPMSRACPVALQQGDVVLNRERSHCVQLRNVRSGKPTEHFVLPVLQLFVGPYSVKHVDNRVGDAVKLSVQFVFDQESTDSNSETNNETNGDTTNNKEDVMADEILSAAVVADSKQEQKNVNTIKTTKNTNTTKTTKTSTTATTTTPSSNLHQSTKKTNIYASTSPPPLESKSLKKRNGGKIRFTAVFPENENTVEARVATLPQVSTMIIIVVVVIFLTFKFHWGVGVLFLLAIAKRFYDFLQNSVFHPYKGTIEFEVNVDDITGIQYNHRLTED